MLPLPNPPESPNVRALASFTRQRFTGLTGPTITLSNAPVTGTEWVVKNGTVLDTAGTYTISGKTVTLVSSAISSDVFHISYYFRTGS